MVILDFLLSLNFVIKEAILISLVGFFVKVSRIKLLYSVDGQANLLDNGRNEGEYFLSIAEAMLDVSSKIPRDNLEYIKVSFRSF